MSDWKGRGGTRSSFWMRIGASRTPLLRHSIMSFLITLLRVGQHPARAWKPCRTNQRRAAPFLLHNPSFQVASWSRLESSLSLTKDDLDRPSSSSVTCSTNGTDRALWKGTAHSTSEFVTHMIASDDAQTVAGAITAEFMKRRGSAESLVRTRDPTLPKRPIPLVNSILTPEELLRLGACWFLPSSVPFDPSLGAKPVRLTEAHATQILEDGDYLRLHHSPRRFPQVYEYNWTAWHPSVTEDDGANTGEEGRPGLVVARDDNKGFWIVDKPADVPVHPTVDNGLENVAEMLRHSLETSSGNEDACSDVVYVATPQRLDQNTSGLMAVATKKIFASYFAKLLRRKTDQQLSTSNGSDQSHASESIHKKYRCLVCLKQDANTSMADGLLRLRSYADEQTLVRHYLEPSIRAPKYFAQSPGNDTWAESLLRVTRVGEPCALVGSREGEQLSLALWSQPDVIPVGCVAVVEVDVALLTGRTHQIRGQLSAEGFPLVGDAQYGGATMPASDMDRGFCVHSERLALQCCELEFLDPDLVQSKDSGEIEAVPSERWNSYQLKGSWWSPLLRTYFAQSGSADIATASGNDADHV